MARISGIDIPRNKRGVIALTYVYGIGRSRAEAEASLRLSLGRDTTTREIELAIDRIAEAVSAARS